MTFPEHVAAELTRVRLRQKPFNSLHEAFAILWEEVDEYWEIVRQKSSKRDPLELLEELIQIAACCQRTAEDFALPRE